MNTSGLRTQTDLILPRHWHDMCFLACVFEIRASQFNAPVNPKLIVFLLFLRGV
jgi:hypothetical protein